MRGLEKDTRLEMSIPHDEERWDGRGVHYDDTHKS